MKVHFSPRSYGVKLLEPKSNLPKVESPITTRMFDVEYFELTGELKYLDEEGETMTKLDQNANAKLIREELTSLDQFNSIGNTKVVANKYGVSTSTAHGLKLSLKAKKAKEEADKILEAQKESITEETRQVYLETEVQELQQSEFDETGSECGESVEQNKLSETELLNDPQFRDKFKDAFAQCTEAIAKDFGNVEDSVKKDQDVPTVLSNEGLERLITALEESWKKPEKDIEELWKAVKSGISNLHKIHLNRAEIEFQERLAGVIDEC